MNLAALVLVIALVFVLVRVRRARKARSAVASGASAVVVAQSIHSTRRAAPRARWSGSRGSM